MKKFLLLALATLSVLISSGQSKSFEFNKEGNPCHIQFSVFAPNEDYASKARPIIYIIGKPGEKSSEIFENDSLKNEPEFYSYLFYYIPTDEKRPVEKLQCLKGLASLSTRNFQYGRKNFFLLINDPSIQESELENSNLYDFFSAIIFNSSIHKEPKDITSSFASDKTEYAAYITGNGKVEKMDEYATYYTEESETKEEKSLPTPEKASKVYFGKPSKKDFTLSGIIRDKVSGETLPFANIIVRGTTIGTSSNADGLFTLLHVPTDTSLLQIQYVGYENLDLYLTPSTPTSNLQVKMYPASQSLQEVTVVSVKEDVLLAKKEDVSVVKLTPKMLEKMPSVGEKDVMRSLQLMPGVGSSNESSSGLYVRGGTPDQNLVLFDGFTVYYVDHLYGFFSAFNSNAIKDVQLYKGGFESTFGGRLSSVSEITGKDGNVNKFNMGADLSLLSVNGYMEIPLGKKVSSIFTYRRSYKGFLYEKIFDKFNGSGEEEEADDETTSDGPPGGFGGPGGRQTQNTTASSFFYDFNGKVTFRPTDLDVISLSFYNGADELDNSMDSDLGNFGGGAFNQSATDITNYGNIGTSLRWSKKWTDKLYSNSTLSYSNYYSERDRSQDRTIIQDEDTTTTKSGVFENNDLRDLSLKSDFQYKLLNNLDIEAGVFGTQFSVDYSYAQSDTATVLSKSDSPYLAGAYLQAPLSIVNDRITMTPGIRSTYYDGTNQVYFEPRFSITGKATERITLKASIGKFYQYINQVTREDILSGGKDFWLMADGKSIPVGSAMHYIAGVSYDTKQYLFSVEGYYKTLNNLTEYSLRFNPSPTGVSYSENFYSGDGIAKGLEFLAQKKYGDLSGWVSYTLSKAENQFDVYGEDFFPAYQDARHEFKIVGLYSYKRWNFSATWIYASGRPYTAPSGAYTITLLDGTEQDYYTVSDKNGLRLPAYHRADLSINYKLLGGIKGDSRRKEIGSIGFSLFNLYNRTNVWYKQYTIEGGDILETNVNYLGITPNLSLTLKLR